MFITHHHSDHNLGNGNLLYGAWLAGGTEPIHTYGPPPLEDMTLLLVLTRSTSGRASPDGGRTPLTPHLQPHEFSEPGSILENDEVKVTAAPVNHPPVVPAFAYSFDTADRSIVISGDTNENAPELVRLAQGADVLVHEVRRSMAAAHLVAPAVQRQP